MKMKIFIRGNSTEMASQYDLNWTKTNASTSSAKYSVPTEKEANIKPARFIVSLKQARDIFFFILFLIVNSKVINFII